MSLSNYTIDIPETAVIVDNWDTLHAEGSKYPWRMLEPKYGGNVIGVDGVIKLVTTDELSKQIEEKMTSIPPHTEEQIAEQKRRERYLIETHMPPDEREKWKKENPERWEGIWREG
jgi:hypothetical protein